MTATALSIQQIQQQARVYPGYLLPRGGTALSLFASGYHGWNDCVHFLRHNMTCDCVDLDETKLEQMRAVYPDDWTFTVADAWQFAEEMADGGAVWDVVSVDTFLGEATERSLASLDLWTSLARFLVTMTVPLGFEAVAPEGWSSFVFRRSVRAAWLVLQHD